MTRPLQLMAEDGSVLGRVSRNETICDLEIGPEITNNTNFYYAFVISATLLLFFSWGFSIDGE